MSMTDTERGCVIRRYAMLCGTHPFYLLRQRRRWAWHHHWLLAAADDAAGAAAAASPVLAVLRSALWSFVADSGRNRPPDST